ncbi:MAG: hypothetical protein WA977_10595 [Halobacteriota archaeon]
MMKKEKKYWRFLFFFAIAMLLLFVLPLSLYPISASASIFMSEEKENETYTMWINDLGCELTDYEIHPDLWHLSIIGSYTVTLNNSGDTDISIRWNAGNDAQDEMIIPAKTVKKYSINFSFHLLSHDSSYEYEEIY